MSIIVFVAIFVLIDSLLFTCLVIQHHLKIHTSFIIIFIFDIIVIVLFIMDNIKVGND